MPSRIHPASQRTTPELSSFRDTPLLQIRLLFATFLEGLFQEAPLGQYHWDPDPNLSEIVVRDEVPINPSEIGARPAISFTVGPHEFSSLGLDDMLHEQSDTGQKTRVGLVPGVMNINCLSRHQIEAHNLAWTIAEHIWLLRDEFLKRGFFDIGRNLVISPPTPAGVLVAGDQGFEWFNVAVSVPYKIPRKGAVTPLAKRILNHIETSLHTRKPQPVESLGVPQGGVETPVSTTAYFPPPFAPNAPDVHGHTPDPVERRDLGAKQPHPLNPAREVVVRPASPNRAGLRGPTINGRPLPILPVRVKQSS